MIIRFILLAEPSIISSRAICFLTFSAQALRCARDRVGARVALARRRRRALQRREAAAPRRAHCPPVPRTSATRDPATRRTRSLRSLRMADPSTLSHFRLLRSLRQLFRMHH